MSAHGCNTIHSRCVDPTHTGAQHHLEPFAFLREIMDCGSCPCALVVPAQVQTTMKPVALVAAQPRQRRLNCPLIVEAKCEQFVDAP